MENNEENNSLSESYTEPTNSYGAPATVEIQQVFDQLMVEMQKGIIGNRGNIELLFISILTNGHVLLEGVPGIAKTMICRLLAQTINSDFQRIQFTPDLMPSDIIGTSVYNMKTSDFTFKKGPIFSNVVLIDEINRSPAKTQAALFEAMEEHQVTADGVTYPLLPPFFVIATQNPIEQEGTYKLPEAQLDRFIFKINLEYPSLEEEVEILKKFRSDFEKEATKQVAHVLTPEKILAFRKMVEEVFISDELTAYIAKVVNGTRNNGDLFLGASPRASLGILKSAKASAAIAGRNFVTPDDIRKVSYHVLSHRIILTPEREMEGKSTKEVINEIIESIEIPR